MPKCWISTSFMTKHMFCYAFVVSYFHRTSVFSKTSISHATSDQTGMWKMIVYWSPLYEFFIKHILWHCFYNAYSTFLWKVTLSFGPIWGMFLEDFVLLQEAARGHPGCTGGEARSAAAGGGSRWLRGTNFGRSWELGNTVRTPQRQALFGEFPIKQIWTS